MMATVRQPEASDLRPVSNKYNGRQEGQRLGFGSKKTLRRSNKTQVTGHVFVSADNDTVNTVCARI